LLGCGIEGPRQGGKQSLFRVLVIEVLDGVTDGLGRPTEPAGDTAADLGERAAGNAGQAPRPPQDPVLFLRRQLRKPPAPVQARLV